MFDEIIGRYGSLSFLPTLKHETITKNSHDYFMLNEGENVYIIKFEMLDYSVHINQGGII